MLLVEPLLQCRLFGAIERQQVLVIKPALVHQTTLLIHGGLYQRLRRAVIFRLHVIHRVANLYVCVMPKLHWRVSQRRAQTISLQDLTDRALNRYYTASPMNDSGLHAYGPLVIQLLIAAFLAGVIASLSKIVGWRRPTKAKLQAYECGMEPTGDARAPFSVKFYLVAMVFILFDVEAIFLYPWAYVFRSLGWYGFLEMMIYIAILLVGYFYLWKKGALDWHK